MIYSVVVTYNGRQWLDKCIQSLVNSSLPNKVIVIDNSSNDGTPEVIRQKYPTVELIEPGHNLGFGQANNIGLKEAYKEGADFVFLINQDAWVEQDTLEKLVNAAKQHLEYGIVSPVHLNGEGDTLDYGFSNYLCRSRIGLFLSDLYLKPKEELAEIYQLDFVNAAFWLLPRKTIETVGGFNPFFFQYGEDRDYVNRCRYFNLKVGFVPLAKAYHARVQHESEVKSKIITRLLFLVKLFNPQESITINAHIKVLVRSIIQSLLAFRFRQARYFIKELKYYHANGKKISSISSRLKIAGLTFLD